MKGSSVSMVVPSPGCPAPSLRSPKVPHLWIMSSFRSIRMWNDSSLNSLLFQGSFKSLRIYTQAGRKSYLPLSLLLGTQSPEASYFASLKSPRLSSGSPHCLRKSQILGISWRRGAWDCRWRALRAETNCFDHQGHRPCPGLTEERGCTDMKWPHRDQTPVVK